jgi:proline iminopeptidase
MKYLLLSALLALGAPAAWPQAPQAQVPAVYPQTEGFVDSNGVLIYYKSVGVGEPLLIVHGGPGASHDYFLPYLLPLMRRNRLIFIDERGSGRSEKLEDPKGYTLEAMVADVDAVRQALGLDKVALLGHSFGGVLAQAYALRHPDRLNQLILCSTFSSSARMNDVFRAQKAAMPRKLRERIAKLEAAGLYGHGRAYERNRYPAEYMSAAWGEGYFPYLYQNRPDPNYDPMANGVMAWDLYREMWGSHGEFLIDGNLGPVDFNPALKTLNVPTLITVGDHDECAPVLAEEMHARIKGSKLVVLPRSGHMTFVDQPRLWLAAVESFLHPQIPLASTN